MSEMYPTFGSYILFKEVLTDDLGHVWRAGELDRKGLHRTVWLRVFDGPRVPSAELSDRLDVANAVGGRLKAATIPTGMRCFSEAGTVAMAWDWSSAQPLNRVFRAVEDEGFPVPVDNCLLILEKISLALSAALTVEVKGDALVHGFLHPGMVMVSTDGEAQVVGLGLGEPLLGLLDHSESNPTLAPYLAPEVVMTRTASKRADVYSLGALLYQLLTNRPLPVEPKERPAALAEAQLAFDDQPIPADIRGLLDRALATRPEDRFSSAADFKKELDKLLYGGAYSPTTFNLALFMDRLFRADVEHEEQERSRESAIDPAPYLRPEPKPEPQEVAPPPTATRAGANRGLRIGLAIAVVVVIALLAVLFGRGPSAPPPTPTPSPEEIHARREAQQQRMQQLVQEQLQQMLAEREQQIREELLARQGKIDELQKRLHQMERQAKGGGEKSKNAEKTKAELQRQIAAEEAAKRQQEAALEKQRQEAIDEAKRRAAEATPVGEVADLQPTVAMQQDSPAEPTAIGATTAAAPPLTAMTQPTAAPVKPTVVPTASAAASPVAGRRISENAFVPAPECDTLPTVLKEQAVVWPRLAILSRRKGLVILQATVNGRGQVQDVKLLRADHEGFGIPQAAMEAVRGYVFKPATKDGVRVTSTATVTVAYAFARN
jgi:TonB family protein